MPPPAVISVRYTEEEADYLSLRPVVRQAFRFPELVDMILQVTGKDAARILRILRSGTVVFRFYRYWWEGLEVAPEELAEVLAGFPDADPGRPFRAEDCQAALFERGDQPARPAFELPRAAASRRRLFRRQSFWEALMELAIRGTPAYRDYSYARRADLYELALMPAQSRALAEAAVRLAPRPLGAQLRFLPSAARVLFLCPRS